MKKVISIIVFIFLIGLICYMYISAPNFIISSGEKDLTFSNYKVKKIDWHTEVNKIKKAFKIDGITKVDNFEVIYKPDGTIKMFSLKLVYLKSNWYYLYNAEYNASSKGYKIYYNRSKEWLQYNISYDENLFCTYLNQVDYDKFRPKVPANYDSYTILYNGRGSSFEKNPNYDIYIVHKAKIDKLIEDNKTFEGFAVFVFGNKIFYYKDHTSEESQSSNVYIFLE